MGAWGQTKRTMRAQVPKVQGGQRRIWRNSDIRNPHGMWSDKPLTGYGSSMMYMDMPHEVAEQHRAGEHGESHYAFYDRDQPLPGHVNHVQFSSQKQYDLEDWGEYRERWAPEEST
jgi:hypothetical protein